MPDDGSSATELAFALEEIHLLISNTKGGRIPGIQLIDAIAPRTPSLPILYIVNIAPAPLRLSRKSCHVTLPIIR